MKRTIGWGQSTRTMRTVALKVMYCDTMLATSGRKAAPCGHGTLYVWSYARRRFCTTTLRVIRVAYPGQGLRGWHVGSLLQRGEPDAAADCGRSAVERRRYRRVNYCEHRNGQSGVPECSVYGCRAPCRPASGKGHVRALARCANRVREGPLPGAQVVSEKGAMEP